MRSMGLMAGVGVLRRLAALAVTWAVCGIVLASAAQAQGQDHLVRLRAGVSRLVEQGKFAQALPIAQQYVELARQKHGEGHPEFGGAVAFLGAVYFAQGRFAEAEPLVKRSLAIFETTFGREHLNVAAALNSLASLYWAQGRYAEAEPIALRSLAIHEKALGPADPAVASALNILAELYRYQGPYAN